MKGYAGKILRVDLSQRRVTEEPLDPQMARDFIGGSGLGLRLLYNEVPPDTDPLGPAARLVIATGPVTATSLGTAGRYEVCFKSPLTGLLCDSSSGGYWGAEFKQAGYDVLILEGRADEPVYLYIHDGAAEIRPAGHLWGKDAYVTQDLLREELGDRHAHVLGIGPAGEHGVLYACMINDAGRTPGRGGTGAVMGSKNLKAIVVRGTQPIELADPAAFKKVAVRINRLNATDPGIEDLRVYGTAQVMDNMWPVGDIPVKNWSLGSEEQLATGLGGKRMVDTIHTPHASCHFCTMGCSRWVKTTADAYKMDGPGPEYETLGSLGSLLLIRDLEAVAYLGHLCNLYGMDHISCGSTIAFAMECYEKGLLTSDDTGGLDLTWGNVDAVMALLEQIAYGHGLGRLLGQGTRRAAEQLGRGAADFAVHVKGLEVPMHDPRALFGWATTYATGPRGACHLHGLTDAYENKQDPLPEWGLTGFYPRQSDVGKAKMGRVAQNWAHIIDSMVICYFAGFTLRPADLAELLNAATGWELTDQDLFVIGDRINALHRAYNYRCGVRRADDRLPVRLLTPLAEGGTGGRVPDVAFQVDEYYELRQWEPDGKPGRAALIELGLSDVSEDLYA